MARPSELFATTLPAAELDSTYVFVRHDEYDGSHRLYLEDLWAEFEPYSDPNFLNEIPRRGHFHARAWEMRLTVVLKRLGLPVCARRTGVGPDIRIDSEPPIWIEAVAPSGTAEQWVMHDLAMRTAVPVREPEIILRYTQAIREKWDKYNGYLDRGIVAPSDCYVIAVSGSALPQASCPSPKLHPWPMTWRLRRSRASDRHLSTCSCSSNRPRSADHDFRRDGWTDLDHVRLSQTRTLLRQRGARSDGAAHRHQGSRRSHPCWAGGRLWSQGRPVSATMTVCLFSESSNVMGDSS